MLRHKELRISTQITNNAWAAESRPAAAPTTLRNLIVRRRIAISLIGFGSLVAYNLAWRGTIPFSPFDLANPWVITAWAMLIIGLAIRSWSAGTLNKSRELTTTGPYSMCRNPLYVGSFLMMFAFCLLCKDLPTLLFVAGPMLWLYWQQVRFEETRLNNLFPDQWPAYTRSTPRFVPRSLPRKPLESWALSWWMTNREYQALTGVTLGLLGIYVLHLWRVSQLG
ncbi:methyltransferase family protein [Aureliella helgolandensis]|uniref:Isoprenylcysteine carboxyl methyltransferase (ICMT) family protein n=1 Tax=Aureliella helgolandensis TaxID=2527968 RepID=A0A518GGJ4_9BACT|nr:isoprenylcysteine carboxylmethyltransferase family protein [Aureliella helgolandensis]QDV27709.1 hypothetical protein Q31a_61020 [Aureliella helgolandensis]